MDTTTARPGETRGEPRTPVQIPTAILSEHFDAPVEVECTDLSPRGMFLASDLLLAPGDRVLVAFIPPGTWHRIVTDAQVVRTGEGPTAGMGLRFDRLPRVETGILRVALGRQEGASRGRSGAAPYTLARSDGAWRC
jgi:hypothetical protein